MYRVNDSNWPIVIFEFNGPQTLAQHENFLGDWNKQFVRNESFVAMRLYHDDNSLVSAEGTAQLTKAWLLNGAAQSIKTSVLALINIVPESAYERMKHLNVEAVFGVPGGIFKRYNDAAQWFNEGVGLASNLHLARLN
jgi:hypothetical protein